MNHEKTRVYERSLALVSMALDVAKRLPPGAAFLGDQLKRASSSVTLNFAEGCRKSSAKERARFFETAACSAREVSAIADIAERMQAIDETERAELKDCCDHVCAMLYKFR